MRRATRLRFRGFDIEGAPVEGEASGLVARVMQHETDHLDGVLYPMRMEDLSLFGFNEELAREAAAARRREGGVMEALSESDRAGRDAAIRAILPLVPRSGWTARTIAAGLRAAGLPEDEAAFLFPRGVTSAIEAWFDLTDREMASAGR